MNVAFHASPKLNHLTRRQMELRRRQERLQAQQQKTRLALRELQRDEENEKLLCLAKMIRDTKYPLDQASVLVGAALELMDKFKVPNCDDLKRLQERYDQYIQSESEMQQPDPPVPIESEDVTIQ